MELKTEQPQVIQPFFDNGLEGDYNYYVKLPITGYEAHVRGIIIREESSLKTGQTKPSFIYETICKLVYNCTKFIDDEKNVDENGNVKKLFPTYDSFLRGLPSADRDALLWGIINKSYEETQDVPFSCPNCKKRFNVQYNIPESMVVKPYLGKESLTDKEVCLELPEYKWKVYMKMPTLMDELKILNYNSSNEKLNAASEYAMITKIELITNKLLANGTTRKGDKMIVESPLEIYGVIADKPVALRKKIMKFFKEQFGDYGIEVQFECMCPECRETIRTVANPMSHLFSLL